MATLELTLISASLDPGVQLDPEPKDIYATVKFAKEQRSTRTAQDHGRSPVWNETLVFNLDNQDFPKFIFVQLFAVQSDAEDELLGVARIPVPTSGTIEGSLHVLVSPSKGETGTLKAAGRWKSTGQEGESHRLFAGDDMAKYKRDDNYASYPRTASTYDDVTSAFLNLAVGKGQEKESHPSPAYPPVAYPPQTKGDERSTLTSSPYPPPFDVSRESYPPAPPVAYPPQTKGDQRSTLTSSPYPPPFDVSRESYPPAPPVAYPPQTKGDERRTLTSSPYPPPYDVSRENYPPAPPYPANPGAYPPYPDYEKSSSSSDQSHLSKEREEKLSSNTTSRGLGDTVEKGHHSHMPYGYPPPPMYGGGYPPPQGYPPQQGYPMQYGAPPGGYPPYPPAPHNLPHSPYGYPPVTHPYQSTQPYPSYGYGPQAPYPMHPGHGSYSPGMYVGHSSSGKHSKHYKHHKMKMPKHSMYNYGHPQPHYPMHGHHYKHKKNKMFGKGFKKFKF